MTSPELLMPAEVAALFRVDAKTVTRWAKQKKLSSIQTVGGHRRYRASEVYELLNVERRSSRHSRLETLVRDYYDGDPTSVLLDLADRYGLAVTVLDRAWFTRFTQRVLTDDEWQRITAELLTSGNTAHAAFADELAAYAATVLSTAGTAGPVSGSEPAAKKHSALASPPGEGRHRTVPARQDRDTDPDIAERSRSTPPASQPPPVASASEAMLPEPAPGLPDPPQSELEPTSSDTDVPAPRSDDVNRPVPHSARVWDYVLGGSEHYEADRQAADTFQEVYPDLMHLMATQRGFKRRAVEYLTEQGVRQFLDIGPGLPSPDDRTRTTDTHIVAASAAPDAMTVYVDNDPLVTTRLQALLIEHVHADIADTHTVLAGATRHLDLSQPVAVLLIGVMGHIDNTDDAHTIVHRLMDALAPGSYLALSDATTTKTALTWAQETYNGTGAAPYLLRTPTRIAEFFTGLVPVQPGLVPPARWRPASPSSGPINTDARCAVARTR